jgi:nucleotide-binding universal stress UspA family protein
MKRILVPVDFSSHTNNSCRYALSVARVTGAEIILFHSFFDQLYFSDGGFSSGFESGIMLTDEIILDFYNQKEARLHEIAADLESEGLKYGKPVTKITCRMESGDPEVQILNAVKIVKPDMIIMGSEGMGKKSLLSGSVARRIIDHTDVPVIAVPMIEDIRPVKNAAYMTPLIPGDLDAISEIETILSDFQVNIFCVHLAKLEDMTDSEMKFKALVENPILNKLGGRISYHILPDNEQGALPGFLKKFSIDLIAFIPHKRNLLQNIFYHGITKEDLFLTHIPVMAIKPVK